MNIIRQWRETSNRVGPLVRKAVKEGGWKTFQEAKDFRQSRPDLFIPYENYCFSVIDDTSQSEVPYYLTLKNLDFDLNDKKSQLAFLMSLRPRLLALNIQGEKIWEGILKPTDDELLIKFSARVYLVVTEERTTSREEWDSAVAENKSLGI